MVPLPSPTPNPAIATTIDADLSCARCVYDLRTLLTGGVCPECALPVAESLRSPIQGPSSLPGVRRALKLWVVASLLCIGVGLLMWIYLRFWYHPILRNRSLSRAVWFGLVHLEYLGGLLKIASVVLLLRAIRSSRTIVGLGCYVLLVLAAFSTLQLAISLWLPGLRPLPTQSAHWFLYMECAPLAVWLATLVAWIRMTKATHADASTRFKRTARVGTAAIAVLLLSSVAYAAIATFFPEWWLNKNPFWSFPRFPTWSGNGAIEKIAEAVLLASVLPWIRPSRHAPIGVEAISTPRILPAESPQNRIDHNPLSRTDLRQRKTGRSQQSNSGVCVTLEKLRN